MTKVENSNLGAKIALACIAVPHAIHDPCWISRKIQEHYIFFFLVKRRLDQVGGLLNVVCENRIDDQVVLFFR